MAQFYKSLSEEQRGLMCFPFGHEFQSRIDNNWFITKSSVSQFSKDQQQLIRDIFHGLHSEEYARRVMQQVEHDNGAAGFGKCAVALFGQPGTGKFEFVLTGRHVTRRCDGDSVAGAAFGGPIFYGHQAGADFDEKPDHPGNAYWYQAKPANEVFQMLDGRQRKLALLDKARPERKEQTVKLSGKDSGLDSACSPASSTCTSFHGGASMAAAASSRARMVSLPPPAKNRTPPQHLGDGPTTSCSPRYTSHGV